MPSLIISDTVDRGVFLANISRHALEEAVARGRDLHGRAHTAEAKKE